MATSESAQDGNNNPVEGGEDTTGFCGAEGYSLAAGLALGMVTLGYGNDNCSDGLADLKIEDKLYNYMVGASVAGAKAETNGQPGQVRMNSAITSASATMALGMMYLKSNNERIAGKLNVPGKITKTLSKNIVVCACMHACS